MEPPGAAGRVVAGVAVADPSTEAILVVDNASDDGTAELLSADFPDVRVIRNPVNTGGAGGFATGLEHALAGECDAVWLMDDDTVPEPGALAALLATRSSYAGDGPRTAPPAVVASRVVWTDGRDHPMNTPRTKAWASRAEREAAAAVGARPVRTASFVSIRVELNAPARSDCRCRSTSCGTTTSSTPRG